MGDAHLTAQVSALAAGGQTRRMSNHAAITVHRPRQEAEHLWHAAEYSSDFIAGLGAAISFADAPGDRGTEIHVELDRSGNPVGRLLGAKTLARVKDELRRFKQHVETGEIPRSDGTPEGERVERKFKRRPAQPLAETELEKAGVS
jgi:hypothetical protein